MVINNTTPPIGIDLTRTFLYDYPSIFLYNCVVLLYVLQFE